MFSKKCIFAGKTEVMKILTEPITVEQLMQIESERFFDYMVKGVVDVQKRIIAVNAELHADLETYLRENGSEEKNLFGINILDDGEVEYDSLINITRNRDMGYPRGGRTVADEETRKEIDKIVEIWIRK